MESDWGRGGRGAVFIHDPAASGGLGVEFMGGVADHGFASNSVLVSAFFRPFNAQLALETPPTVGCWQPAETLSFAAKPPTMDRFTVGGWANRVLPRVSLSNLLCRSNDSVTNLSDSTPVENCRGHSDQAQDQARCH